MMAAPVAVLAACRAALGRWVVFTGLHLSVRLAVTALLAPLAGLALGLDGLHRAAAPEVLHPAETAAPRTGGAIAAALVLTAGVAAAGALSLVDDVRRALASPRTVEIIAHRGAAGARPENTLAAVEKALEDRADWVESDVQETADGAVIVAHDSDFMKQAGVPLKVWNATRAELETIDIGSWFDPAHAGERVPTLRAVLEVAKGRGRVMIELKYYGHDQRLEQRVARIVKETGMEGDVMIMSLKPAGVAKMRALRPGWPVGILAARAIGDLAGVDADFLAVNTGQVSMALVRRARAAGKTLYVWTVDDPRTMSRMISMGVDGLITNEPALARQVMAERATLGAPERLLLWLTDRFRLPSLDLVAEPSGA